MAQLVVGGHGHAATAVAVAALAGVLSSPSSRPSISQVAALNRRIFYDVVGERCGDGS